MIGTFHMSIEDFEPVVRKMQQAFDQGIHIVVLGHLKGASIEESLVFYAKEAPFFTWPARAYMSEIAPSPLRTQHIRYLVPFPCVRHGQQALALLLHRTMAYQAEVMPLEAAEELSAEFMVQFGTDAQCFTNGDWYDKALINTRAERKEGYDVVSPASWYPCTDASFDCGIIIRNERYIGIVWFTDED